MIVMKDIFKIIENILFVWGDPMEIKELAKVLDLKVSEVKSIIKEMEEDFSLNRGLSLVVSGDQVQLTSKEEYIDWIKKLTVKIEKVKLSNAALEVLSIIAYKQPVTKSEIDSIRGVKSDKVIETLMSRNLIYEAGRLDSPGRPIIYRTTDDFLSLLSISSIDELPEVRLEGD